MSNIICNDPYEFMSKWIDIATILNMPEKYKLKDREKEFLVNTILYSSNGVDIESKEMVELLCKAMKIKPANVYNYRKILKDKHWLEQTPTKLKLLDVIDYTYRELPKELNFKFKIQY